MLHIVFKNYVLQIYFKILYKKMEKSPVTTLAKQQLIKEIELG